MTRDEREILVALADHVGTIRESRADDGAAFRVDDLCDVVEAALRCLAASAGEAGTAATTKIDAVHEHAVAESETPTTPPQANNQ